MNPSPSVAPAALTPLKRFAKASTTTCAAQATAYGKCILATYTDVQKDICKAEFEQFGKCMRDAVRPSSGPSKSYIVIEILLPLVYKMKRNW